MPVSMVINKEEYDKNPENCSVVEEISGTKGPFYLRESHHGLVLELTIKDWWDDWDHIAIVWNEENQAPERIMYATTRGWTGGNYAAVDASDELQEKYRKYQAEKRAEERKKNPQKGDQVVVTKGRKVPIGVEGEMFWMKEQNYSGKKVVRIGVKDSEGSVHWTYLKNVMGV